MNQCTRSHGTSLRKGSFARQAVNAVRARSSSQAHRRAIAVTNAIDEPPRRGLCQGWRIGNDNDLRTACCGHGAVIMTNSTDWPPAPSVARQQFVGFLRSLAAGAIACQAPVPRLAKGVEERLDHAPARLNAVGAPRIKIASPVMQS